ncbi:MAG: DUF1540 domain-containing protein [Lachnospiraceae bacterium]|nr:DUF1540 domain-containing protein [Lachnospiraceae bacterium]
MNKLKCYVNTCAYNDKERCYLDGIKVRGTDAKKSEATSCGSFREKTKNGNDNYEFAEEMPEKSNIECDAFNCLHNCDKNCMAKRVGIKGKEAGSFDDTCCNTFKME